MDQRKKNILIAMDGSERLPETIRYVSSLFRNGQARITLFHVMDLFPESFLDLESGSDLRYELTGMREWDFALKSRIRSFMEDAVQFLVSTGYKEGDVTVIVEDRVVDVARSIALEGDRGYDALVLGRSGIELIENLVLKNIPNRLVGMLDRLPVWIVGGSSDTRKILIAVDSSQGAEKALEYIGKIFSNVYPETLLLHVSRRIGMFEPEFGQFDVVHEGRDWVERSSADLELGEGGMESYLLKCISRLERKNAERIRIKTEMTHEARSVSEAIMKEAVDGDYGTIVLGRRSLSKIDEIIRRRIGNMVLQLAKEKAVWIVH